jgi:hypothetical protein
MCEFSIYYKIILWFFTKFKQGPSWLWSYGSWIYNYLCNQFLSPLMLWVRISIRAKCTTLCDTFYQWLATGRWFSPGTRISSTNETDCHDITEILLKVALNTIKKTKKQIQGSSIYKLPESYILNSLSFNFHSSY